MSASLNPLKFTGLSTFSEDLQSIPARATQVAALPVKRMQNQQADLITKQQSITALGTSVKGLANAIRDSVRPWRQPWVERHQQRYLGGSVFAQRGYDADILYHHRHHAADSGGVPPQL